MEPEITGSARVGRRGIVVTVASAALLLLFLGIAANRAWTWRERPWAGMTFGSADHEVAAYRFYGFRAGEISHAVVDRSPAAEAAVDSSARVVAVEGIPVGEPTRLRQALKDLEVGDPVEYTLLQDGEQRSVTLTLEAALENPVVVLDLLVASGVGLAFLVVAWVVLSKRPGDLRARLFYLLSSTTAFVFLADAVLRVEKATPWGESVRERALLGASGGALVTVCLALLLHFALVFPETRPSLRKRPRVTLGGLYGAMASILLLHFVQLFPLEEQASVVVGVIALPLILGFGACTVIGSWVAFRRSYREAGPEGRRQLQWPLWSFGVAFLTPFVLALVSGFVAAFLQRTEGYRYRFFDSDLSRVALDALYLLIPLAFAFAILKHRLLEIDRILRKTTVYGILTFLLGFLFLVVAGGLGSWLGRATGIDQDWVLVASTLVVAAALLPLRQQVQSVVERRLFPRRFSYPEALDRLRRKARAPEEESAFARTVVETIQGALDVETTAILTREEGALRPLASLGLSDRQRSRLRLPLRGPLATGSSAWLGHGSLPEEHEAALEAARIAALQPARLGTDTVGALAVGRRLDHEPFADEDLRFLEQAADLYADGMSRLDTSRRSEEAEEARRIQAGLLPQELPTLRNGEIAATWRPAREVGGDAYDVVRLDDDRVLFCIADVVGKGVPAALLMSNLQATIRAFAGPDLGPAELCLRLHRLVRGNVAMGKFITFFGAVFDERDRRLRYANAGQVPPLLLRADGSWRELTEGGPALGAFSRAEYDEGAIRLEAGDRVVLFTDGVTEAMDPQGRMLGDDGVLEVLLLHRETPASSLVEALAQAVENHAGGARADDTTIVVLATEGNGAGSAPSAER